MSSGPVTVVFPPYPAWIRQISRHRGSTLSLVCKNVAGPVIWTKNGGPLPDYCTENVWNARCLNYGQYKNQRLTIKNVTKEDEGRYRCKANNKESLPFMFNVSDDDSSPYELRLDSTYKPTAFPSSPTNVQGTNWSSMSLPTEKPTLEGVFSTQLLLNSTSSYLVTGSTGKRDAYKVCTTMTADCRHSIDDSKHKDDSLTIGLAAGVPCAVVLFVLAFVVFCLAKKRLTCPPGEFVTPDFRIVK